MSYEAPSCPFSAYAGVYGRAQNDTSSSHAWASTSYFLFAQFQFIVIVLQKCRYRRLGAIAPASLQLHVCKLASFTIRKPCKSVRARAGESNACVRSGTPEELLRNLCSERERDKERKTESAIPRGKIVEEKKGGGGVIKTVMTDA